MIQESGLDVVGYDPDRDACGYEPDQCEFESFLPVTEQGLYQQ